MRILCLSDFRGEVGLLPALQREAKNLEPDLIVFTGNIVKGKERRAEYFQARREGRRPNLHKPEVIEEEKEDLEFYRRFYQTLAELETPVLIVPGQLDAPEERFLKASLPREFVHRNIQVIHKSFYVKRNFVFVGMGGEITEEERETEFLLKYPRWELEWTLDMLDYLDQVPIFVFHHPPRGQHVDLHEGTHIGSEYVRTLIKTFDPHFLICGTGDTQAYEYIGSTLVVNPGPLHLGKYALLNMRREQVELCSLEV